MMTFHYFYAYNCFCVKLIITFKQKQFWYHSQTVKTCQLTANGRRWSTF